jgi:hypothetical protein
VDDHLRVAGHRELVGLVDERRVGNVAAFIEFLAEVAFQRGEADRLAVAQATNRQIASCVIQRQRGRATIMRSSSLAWNGGCPLLSPFGISKKSPEPLGAGLNWLRCSPARRERSGPGVRGHPRNPAWGLSTVVAPSAHEAPTAMPEDHAASASAR